MERRIDHLSSDVYTGRLGKTMCRRDHLDLAWLPNRLAGRQCHVELSAAVGRGQRRLRQDAALDCPLEVGVAVQREQGYGCIDRVDGEDVPVRAASRRAPARVSLVAGIVLPADAGAWGRLSQFGSLVGEHPVCEATVGSVWIE